MLQSARGFESHLLRHFLIIMIKNKRFNIAILSIILLILAIVPILLAPIVLLIFNKVIIAFTFLLFYYIFNYIALISAYNNNRTDIQTKITWTFIELFLPGAGSYIYYFFARVPKKIKNQLKESELLENEILNKEVSNSTFEILKNGEQKYTDLFRELENAKQYINIQYFILTQGILQEKLFSILKRKKAEGLKIRIVIDDLGSINFIQFKMNELIAQGFEIIRFRPINWFKLSGADNWRSHIKLIVIDGKVGYFGGVNFADEYGSLLGKYGDWVDFHCKCWGDVVLSLDSIFFIQWFITTNQKINHEYKPFYDLLTGIDESSVSRTRMHTFENIEDFQITQEEKMKIKKESIDNRIEILYDSPERKEPLTFNEIKKEIRNAKKSVRIISPYVTFPISFKNEIRKSIHRGVKIELITIGLADKKIAYYQGSFDVETLTGLGVEVYRTDNIFIHSKMFIFDDNKAIIGTTNLDYRAFFQHFEVNLKIRSKKVLDLIDYFKEIKEISTIQLKKRSEWSIGRIIMYSFVRFFKGLF